MKNRQSPTDYTRPSTWIRYRSAMCDGCHADCCRLPVEVHLTEFVTMGLASQEELEEPFELVKRLKKEKIIRLFDQKRQMATLCQQADGSCLYLDKNRLCTLYERRPQTCHHFPTIGPRSGHCPYNQK